MPDQNLKLMPNLLDFATQIIISLSNMTPVIHCTVANVYIPSTSHNFINCFNHNFYALSTDMNTVSLHSF